MFGQEWFEHKTNEMPKNIPSPETKVEIARASGELLMAFAKDVKWKRNGTYMDIVDYRICDDSEEFIPYIPNSQSFSISY